jgi:hypothetical protein
MLTKTGARKARARPTSSNTWEATTIRRGLPGRPCARKVFPFYTLPFG